MSGARIVASERIALAAPDRQEFVERWPIFNDPEFTMLLGLPTTGSSPASGTMPPYTREQREAFYEGLVRRGVLIFDLERLEDGACIGEGYLFGITWPRASAELGTAIFRREDRGQGFGTEAVLLMCAYAFDCLNLHRIVIRYPAESDGVLIPMERVAPDVGGRKVGVERDAEWAFGRYHDIALWEVLKQDFPPHESTAHMRGFQGLTAEANSQTTTGAKNAARGASARPRL